MTTTTPARDFVRNFSRLRKVAANGGEVIAQDRFGRTFVFAQPIERVPPWAITLMTCEGQSQQLSEEKA